MSAKEWAGEHETYDKRAMTCLERYAEIEHGTIGSEYELELVLREAQVWATLAGAAASRAVAERLGETMVVSSGLPPGLIRTEPLEVDR